jgi:hypothetical protein
MYKSSDKSSLLTSIEMRQGRAEQIVEMHPTDMKSKATDIEEDLTYIIKLHGIQESKYSLSILTPSL